MQAECRQKAELSERPCYSIPQLSAQKKRIVDSLQEILPPRARTAGRERSVCNETAGKSGSVRYAAGHGGLGAVGVMAATQNQRQLRRTTRKVMKGAENAVLQLDRMVGDFVEKHMDS